MREKVAFGLDLRALGHSLPHFAGPGTTDERRGMPFFFTGLLKTLYGLGYLENSLKPPRSFHTLIDAV